MVQLKKQNWVPVKVSKLTSTYLFWTDCMLSSTESRRLYQTVAIVWIFAQCFASGSQKWWSIIQKTSSLAEELVDFREYFKRKYKQPRKENISDKAVGVELQMHCVGKEKVREVFPNVAIVLRIYLTLMANNCLGERSFFALKSIKNVFRSTMKDQ